MKIEIEISETDYGKIRSTVMTVEEMRGGIWIFRGRCRQGRNNSQSSDELRAVKWDG